MLNENNSEVNKTRQEKRDERLLKKKSKVQQHGRRLGQIYRHAILKRIKRSSPP